MTERVMNLANQFGIDPADAMEFWSERAAVREYVGGQSRGEAEDGALADTREWLSAKGRL